MSSTPNGVHLSELGREGTSDDTMTSEKMKLVDRPKLTVQEAVRLRLAILVISWLSVVGLFILGITTLVIGILTQSTASFAFALDAWLDCLSSVVVLWRFSSAAKLYSSKREKIACLVLGGLFLVSSVVVITKSSIAISDDTHPKQSNLIWYLSIVNGTTCLFLASFKVYLAKRLKSIAVATDAINSVIGAVLAFSTLVSDLVFAAYPSVWYLDATVGIICALFLMAYGIWVIIFQLFFSEGEDNIVEHGG